MEVHGFALLKSFFLYLAVTTKIIYNALIVRRHKLYYLGIALSLL